MNKEQIMNDLQYIVVRLQNLNIKGSDAGLMNEIFMGLQDIERILNMPEVPQEESGPKEE